MLSFFPGKSARKIFQQMFLILSKLTILSNFCFKHFCLRGLRGVPWAKSVWSIFWKIFLADFLRKRLKIWFSQKDSDKNLKFFDFLLWIFPFFATMPTLTMRHVKSLKSFVAHCALRTSLRWRCTRKVKIQI